MILLEESMIFEEISLCSPVYSSLYLLCLASLRIISKLACM